MDGSSLRRHMSRRFVVTQKFNASSICQFQYTNFFIAGFYGKHCMESCSCPSPQFVCHAAQGCVCRVGYIGTDCLTPRGQAQELSNSMLSQWFACKLKNLIRKIKSEIEILRFFIHSRSKFCWHCMGNDCCFDTGWRYSIFVVVFPTTRAQFENGNRSCSIYRRSTSTTRSTPFW